MTTPDMGWWCIKGDELLSLMRRAHEGEDPDLLYAEAYANAKVEKPGESDDAQS